FWTAEPQRHVLFGGATTDQPQRLFDQPDEVQRRPLQARWSGKVKEGLQRALNATHLRLDDFQVRRRQRADANFLADPLDEHLDGSQRVADLVGDAGGELTDGGQLLRPQYLALTLLQPLDHLPNLTDQGLDLLVQPFEVALL